MSGQGNLDELELVILMLLYNRDEEGNKRIENYKELGFESDKQFASYLKRLKEKGYVSYDDNKVFLPDGTFMYHEDVHLTPYGRNMLK